MAADEVGVPAAPIWDLEQALDSEHVEHRHTLGYFDHPVLGRTPFLRQPIGFGADAPVEAVTSPALGADSAREVLTA